VLVIALQTPVVAVVVVVVAAVVVIITYNQYSISTVYWSWRLSRFYLTLILHLLHLLNASHIVQVNIGKIINLNHREG